MDKAAGRGEAAGLGAGATALAFIGVNIFYPGFPVYTQGLILIGTGEITIRCSALLTDQDGKIGSKGITLQFISRQGRAVFLFVGEGADEAANPAPGA